MNSEKPQDRSKASCNGYLGAEHDYQIHEKRKYETSAKPFSGAQKIRAMEAYCAKGISGILYNRQNSWELRQCRFGLSTLVNEKKIEMKNK